MKYTEDRNFLFTADCPPLGMIDIEVGSSGAGTSLDLESLQKGIIEVTHTQSDGGSKIDEENHALLNVNWINLWPVLLKRLNRARADYERDAPLTAENSEFVISPPGDCEGVDVDHWGISVEMKDPEKWDGVYWVDFQIDGEILDAGATF